MSEAADTTLNTPAPALADAGAAPAAEAAPAAAAAGETLITPETVQEPAAAAEGQGDGKGEGADGAQAEGEQPPVKKEGEAEPPADDAAPGAPEAYADFTMPEGFQLPAEIGADLTTLAKALNLPQAEAQKLVDIGVKHAQALQGAMTDTLNTAKATWAEQVRNDTEIGGLQLAQNMAVAAKAVVAFGSPALTKVLNDTGLSQHPEMLRLLVRVGAAISEDTDLVTGDGGKGGERPAVRDHASRMYPKMAKAT